MAKKSSNNIKIKNFDELSSILQNSFSAIKKDIDGMAESIHVMQTSVAETSKKIEDSRKDFVTIDKINALKIKIADMNEAVKRLDRIESSVSKASEKTVDKDKFDAERQKTKERLDEIRNSLDFVEKLAKATVTEARLKQLAKEVSKEINEMVKRLETYEQKGGEVVETIARKLTEEITTKVKEQDERFNVKSSSLREEVKENIESLNDTVKDYLAAERNEAHRKMLKLHEGIGKMREENRKLITKNQVNELLRRINTEFDSVKESVDDLNMLKRDIKQIRKDKLNKSGFEQKVADVNKDLAEIKEYLAKINEEVKDNKKLQKEVESLKQKVANVKPKPARRLNILTIANILIALAFVLLGVSLALYFTDKVGYMNYVIIGAVVFFVAGIAIRIISVLKE